jgi:aryl-phospho-beta-D-glucosidase BglC (GH1 family)
LQRVPYPSSPQIITAQKPRILAFIAANGLDVSEANSALIAYGNENWNKSRHLAMLEPLVTWNKAHGGNRKFFCAEFGVLDANQAKTMNGIDSGPDPAARIQFIKDRRQAFEERNIGWSYWSFNEAFTVLDPALRTTFDPAPDVNMISKPAITALGLHACEH